MGTSDPSGTDEANTEANTITAQTEMVPADWALKPADIAAGGQFRLMFVSSTTRDATSTDIAAYNTFVSTRAAAGVTAMRTYADDFTALVSTETVNARANTLTRATDTDAPIYRARSGTVSANDRVADDYADFYDGTWPTSAPWVRRVRDLSEHRPPILLDRNERGWNHARHRIHGGQFTRQSLECFGKYRRFHQ